ncbi:MAG: hypothetical protein K0B08_03665 [Bacteroidales bacterium]|nr:hypothetical protein [Bacteroidales bacterium]
MKKFFKLLIILPFLSQAQVSPDSPEYQQMKLDGSLMQENHKVYEATSQPIDFEQDASRSTGFYIPLDGTFSLAMGPNDDGSSSLITLPFTFCLYGDQYTSLYINNNGNLTFTSPTSTFTPFAFPSTPLAIVAPFFADVDTRPAGGGAVWYKIETSPNRITIIWNVVGYYNLHTDKLNTFQVILTDGNDPLIGIGKNVAFAYEEMQWTTGDFSGGVNGFGGSPATVGVNKGDGVKYALVGRFDAPGTCYDGPFGANDCVGFLSGKRFVFNACQDEIIINPPDPEVPIGNWALFIGIGLIFVFTVIRFRRIG